MTKRHDKHENHIYNEALDIYWQIFEYFFHFILCSFVFSVLQLTQFPIESIFIVHKNVNPS